MPFSISFLLSSYDELTVSNKYSGAFLSIHVFPATTHISLLLASSKNLLTLVGDEVQKLETVVVPFCRHKLSVSDAIFDAYSGSINFFLLGMYNH